MVLMEYKNVWPPTLCLKLMGSSILTETLLIMRSKLIFPRFTWDMTLNTAEQIDFMSSDFSYGESPYSLHMRL